MAVRSANVVPSAVVRLAPAVRARPRSHVIDWSDRQPLDEPPDEPVVAGTQGLGLGGQRDAARIRSPMITSVGAAGWSATVSSASPPSIARRLIERTEIAVFGQQPRLDALEQALAGRDAQDQATPRGLADDAGERAG